MNVKDKKIFKSDISFTDSAIYTKDLFPYYGIIGFCGKQGSGKSYSALTLISRLNEMYNVRVISNIDIGIEHLKYNGIDSLFNYNYMADDTDGAIVFIDEMSDEFNNVKYKDFNTDWFLIINMLRKRHMLIIGTCPVFNRIQKAFREQFDFFVDCDNFILPLINRRLQINDIYIQRSVSMFDDSMFNFDFCKRQYLIHKKSIYNLYNSLELVDRKEN